MTIKTYGVDGLLEWHINVPAGRVLLNIEFTNGKFSGYCIAPAVYRTADPVVQQAIERTTYFRSGRIRIVSVREEASAADGDEKSPMKRDIPGMRRIIDVPDWNSARLQLTRISGVSPDRLKTLAQMRAVAAEHNVEFRTPRPV